MKTMRLLILCLMCVWLGILPLQAQDNYTGSNKELIQRSAFRALNTFYGHVIDAAREPEYAEIILSNLKSDYVHPESVFQQDFTRKSRGNQANVLSLENYVVELGNAYRTYLKDSQVRPEAFTIQLDAPHYHGVTFTEDHNGFTVHLTYQVQVSSAGKTLYQGKSESIVVFEDLMNLTHYQIRQIMPDSNTAKPSRTYTSSKPVNTVTTPQSPKVSKNIRPAKSRRKKDKSGFMIEGSTVVKNCTGIIFDSTGEPVIGAAIVVKGTMNGTITDFDGKFTISDVRKGSVIAVSFVGFKTFEFVWNQHPVTVFLAED